MRYITNLPQVGSNGTLQANEPKKKIENSEFRTILKEEMKASAFEKRQTVDLEPIFQRAAEQYNVPLSLLKAVAKAESGFRVGAVSHCGAQGIMQLMPKTAASLGVQDAFDPEQNIMAGANYLSQKLRQYNGNIPLTLAAYNAGSGNVKKYNGIPPFQETHNYIDKVLGYMDSDLNCDRVSMAEKFQYIPGFESDVELDELTRIHFEEILKAFVRMDGLSQSLGSLTLGELNDEGKTNLEPNS